MASYGRLMTRTMQAAADLRQKQYHFLRAAGAGTCDQASEAAGGFNDLIGVLINKPDSGQAATVAYQGECKVVAGGSVTVNGGITTNGSGRAANITSGDMLIGVALEAAGADGETIRASIGFPISPTLRT